MNKPFNREQRLQHLAVVLLIVVAATAQFLIFATPHKNSQKLHSYAATNCTLSTLLINSCRPWIGTSAGKYSATGGLTQLQYAEKRFNNPNALTNPALSVTNTKQFDIMHIYNNVGSNTVTAEEQGYAKRANTILLLNWKPTGTWSKAAGGDAATNAAIKTMADSIKALGSTKIMLAIFHEPENNVSSGNCTANAANASAGSPTDYVNMWHNVRSIFNTEGVSNVVWVMNYMGYSGWNCLVPLLWPGNSYVDIITYDKYGSGSENFTSSTQPFYDLLTSTSDATHAYTSKPWGLSEFGYNSGTEANAISYWSSAASAVTSNHFPNLKLYVLFDSTGSGDSRVGYDINGSLNLTEQTAFNSFADTVQGIGGGPPPPPPTDTINPTVSITGPANGSTVNATITVSVAASDNVGVTRVRIVWDGTNVIRDSTTQGTYGWGSQWNTAGAPDGSHSITATAYDAAGNTSSSTINLTIHNSPTILPPVINSFTTSPGTVIVGQTSSLAWNTSNTVNCSVNPGGPQNSPATSWTTLAYTTPGTTTYTLSCKNSAGTSVSKTASVTVNVAPTAPTNVTLTPSATTIQTGGSVLLTWSSNGSTSCTLNPGSITVAGGSSSKNITNLTSTTTYKVTCTNSVGSTSSSPVTVTVQPTPPPPANPVINSLTADPTNVSSGGTSTITWQATNVISGGCLLVPSGLPPKDATFSWTTAPLTSSQSYTLTCKNSANVAVSKSVSVTVNNVTPPVDPPPTDPGNITPPTGDNSSVVTATTGESVDNTQNSDGSTQGDLLTLDAANVTDPATIKNIVKVEYYQNDQLIQTVTSPPFALDSSKLQPGTYNLTQRTYYVDGSTSQQSQLVTIKAKTVANVAHNGSKGSWWAGIAAGLFIVAYVVFLRRRLHHVASRRSGGSSDDDLPTIIMPTDPQTRL